MQSAEPIDIKEPTDVDDKQKVLYIKVQPRLYNSELTTEAYAGVVRLGAILAGSNNTTIVEVGPQWLNFRNSSVFSIDAAVESYWNVSKGIEAYGRWYPSYVEGYNKTDWFNSVAAGMVFRLNGGVVDVNEYSGLTSLTRGQYIKVEQQLSTYKGFSWSGSASSARLGWAAHGKRWSLTLEAGVTYGSDIYDGERIRPSGVFEFYYQMAKNTNLILSYYPNLDAGFNGPSRGELGVAVVQRF